MFTIVGGGKKTATTRSICSWILKTVLTVFAPTPAFSLALIVTRGAPVADNFTVLYYTVNCAVKT